MPIERPPSSTRRRNAWRPNTPVFEDTGKGEPVRAPSADTGEGRLLSSLTLVRLRRGPEGGARPRQARPAGQEGRRRAADRRAQVPEGGDVPERLRAAAARRCSSSWPAFRRSWTSEANGTRSVAVLGPVVGASAAAPATAAPSVPLRLRHPSPARPSRRSPGLLPVAHARRRSVSSRRRRLGPRAVPGRQQRVPHRGRASRSQRPLPRPLGPPAPRALQRRRGRQSVQRSASARPEERRRLSRPRARERRRLRQQGAGIRRQGARTRSEAGRRPTSSWPTSPSKTPIRRRRSSEADAALAIAPDALDAMAIHAAVELLADRSPDAWIQMEPRGQSDVRQGLRPDRLPSRAQPPLRGRRRLLSQGHRSRSAALVGAIAARHQPDASRSGGRTAPAARVVLQQRLPRRGHRQQPPLARQLQELRRLQGRRPRSSSSTRRRPISSTPTSPAC